MWPSWLCTAILYRQIWRNTCTCLNDIYTSGTKAAERFCPPNFPKLIIPMHPLAEAHCCPAVSPSWQFSTTISIQNSLAEGREPELANWKVHRPKSDTYLPSLPKIYESRKMCVFSLFWLICFKMNVVFPVPAVPKSNVSILLSSFPYWQSDCIKSN